MSSSIRAYLFLLTLFLPLWFTPFAGPFVNGDANLVEKTCKQTMAPILCETCLTPDPRIDTADLKGLVKILFGCGINQAIVTWKYMQRLANNATTDPHLSDAINKCLPEFLPVGGHLVNGSTLIYFNDYVTAKQEVRTAESLVFVCLDKFRQYPTIVTPHKLLAAMLEFEGLCQIVGRLINTLH